MELIGIGFACHSLVVDPLTPHPPHVLCISSTLGTIYNFNFCQPLQMMVASHSDINLHFYDDEEMSTCPRLSSSSLPFLFGSPIPLDLSLSLLPRRPPHSPQNSLFLSVLLPLSPLHTLILLLGKPISHPHYFSITDL